MAKAKVKVDTTKNGKHGDIIQIERFEEMEDYLKNAKDMLISHDDDIDEVKKDIKALMGKIDRALSRLGIS